VHAFCNTDIGGATSADGWRSAQAEESMFKANKNTAHAVCIVNDGAAARCVLGLLVVVVLMLSN
jgi:hypothetical protein